MLRSSPTPVLSASPKTIMKAQSSGDLDNMQRLAPRCYLSVITSLYASAHVAHAPQVDRGDPFNLGSFYPASDERSGDWMWLQEPKAEALPPQAILSRVSEDEDVGHAKVSNVLRCEDKLGVLSLRACSVLSRCALRLRCLDMSDAFTKAFVDTKFSEADTQLLSPYVVDEAVDHDALHHLYLRRRVMAETPDVSPPAAFTFLLFGSEQDEPDLSQIPSSAWISGINAVVDWAS